MNFIFWQNVVSIHQSAFIKALAREHEVTLVAAETIDAQRRREKWNVPSMGNAKVVVAPNDALIADLINQPDVHHVFSGINAYPMVYRALKMAVKKGLKVSIMAEPYEWAGVKGMLRRLMYATLYLRYGRHIEHFFATGNMGVKCYRKAGFPARKLHQWGYFTEQNEPAVRANQNRKLPNLIFIGKIDERKNILALARCAVKLSNRFEKMTIVGTGPLESELKEIIARTPNIEFIGPIPNAEIADYLANSDLLVLPSLFDGWGAVVNEALAQGTRVLCSNRCGAETLLDGEKRGGIFSLDKDSDLEAQLSYWIANGPISSEERAEISHWANQNISGEAASTYFSNLTNGQLADTPWITPPTSSKPL